jgi:hypothetical protein
MEDNGGEKKRYQSDSVSSKNDVLDSDDSSVAVVSLS